MLHWMERRIGKLAGRQPGRWEYAGNASSTETEATALLLDNGYRPAYTVLEMDLDWNAFAAQLETEFGEQEFGEQEFGEQEFALRNSVSSVGVTIDRGRIEDADRIAASIDESYIHEYPDGRYAERFDPVAYAAELAGPPHDPALWRVAWVGDEVVGQVIPRIERGRAEVYEVSVRPAWRRRGIARALLSDALLGLQHTGMPVRLHTVAEFPTQAHRLYSGLGFRVLKEFPRYRKPA
jgi:ribosomal protein S18 acetylase RimI-like enzyme